MKVLVLGGCGSQGRAALYDLLPAAVHQGIDTRDELRRRPYSRTHEQPFFLVQGRIGEIEIFV